MAVLKADVQAYVLEVLTQLANDWEYGEAITPTTYLFTGLGFQSLDAVVLGNALQEHYGRIIPYAEFLAEIGQREFNDATVGEWIDFTYRHVNTSASGSGVPEGT